jgi:uncharacterized protein with von Willebrand factor type A (vWA) domain
MTTGGTARKGHCLGISLCNQNGRDRARGMAAALPYCGALISGHNYAALAEAATAIRAER